jgi:hypothetical protein
MSSHSDMLVVLRLLSVLSGKQCFIQISWLWGNRVCWRKIPARGSGGLNVLGFLKFWGAVSPSRSGSNTADKVINLYSAYTRAITNSKQNFRTTYAVGPIVHFASINLGYKNPCKALSRT